jgi:hypothetical protein
MAHDALGRLRRGPSVDGHRHHLSLPPTPIIPRPLVTFAAICGDHLRRDQHCLGVLTTSPTAVIRQRCQVVAAAGVESG